MKGMSLLVRLDGFWLSPRRMDAIGEPDTSFAGAPGRPGAPRGLALSGSLEFRDRPYCQRQVRQLVVVDRRAGRPPAGGQAKKAAASPIGSPLGRHPPRRL